MVRYGMPSDSEDPAPSSSTAKGKGRQKPKKETHKQRKGLSGPGIEIPGNDEGGPAVRNSSDSGDDPLIETSKGKGKKRAEKKKKPEYGVLYDKLFRMRHEPTKFPDPELLQRLGIHDDVLMILQGMGLGSLMGMSYSSRKEEMCEFLASLQAEFFSREPQEDWGSGYISFRIKRKTNQIGFTELSRIMGILEVIPGEHKLTPSTKKQNTCGVLLDQHPMFQASSRTLRLDILQFAMWQSFSQRHTMGRKNQVE